MVSEVVVVVGGWGVGVGQWQLGALFLLLLLLKFILHHIASHNASKFGAYVTKGDVGNESTPMESWSSPQLMSMDEKSTKKSVYQCPKILMTQIKMINHA